MKKPFLTGAIAIVAVAGLTLSGCSANSGDAGSSASDRPVMLTTVPGWDEGTAAAYLWQEVLEDAGYDAEVVTAEMAPIYQGLSDGDFDLFFDTMLPKTHEEYINRYGDDLVELSKWSSSQLTIAVNEDAPIDSLTEFAANADAFGNRLVGIDQGATLTRLVKENTTPTYGLESVDFQTSSATAMLAELKAATAKGENIAVTLWRPHWAYSAFPLKDLKDPEQTLGGKEGIFAYSSKKFVADFPAVADKMKTFVMSDELLHSLENEIFNGEKSDDPEAATRAWMDANPDFVATIKL